MLHLQGEQMATERVKKIRGTRPELGAILRRAYAEGRDSDCEPLTFDDLEVGDKFIVMPLPGDNSGHDGLLGEARLFRKINPTKSTKSVANIYYNAARLISSDLAHINDNEWVYKVK